MSIGRVLAEMKGKGDLMSASGNASTGGQRFQVARWAVRKLLIEPISAAWSYVTDSDGYEEDSNETTAEAVQGRHAYVPLLKVRGERMQGVETSTCIEGAWPYIGTMVLCVSAGAVFGTGGLLPGSPGRGEDAEPGGGGGGRW